MIQAQTQYGVPIVAKSFQTRKDAVQWATHDGQRYGCARVVQDTARGKRTIWRSA